MPAIMPPPRLLEVVSTTTCGDIATIEPTSQVTDTPAPSVTFATVEAVLHNNSICMLPPEGRAT
jgi:hypothetical protein